MSRMNRMDFRASVTDMEWPNELVLDFLQFYENEPVIWNPSFPNHKNRNDVFDAWKRIERKMDNKFSVTELKKKKDSLMASFRTCLKKVKDSSKSGAGSGDIYKPKKKIGCKNWFAYEVMERFLKDKNMPRETLSSELAPPANEEQNESERNVDWPDLSDNVTSESMEEPDKGNEAIVLPARATPAPNSAASSFKPPPRKKSRVADEIEIKQKMNSAFTALQSLQPKKEKHLCDIYGELLAAKLKMMDESTREVCMHRIDNIVFEMRMMKGPATSGNTYFMQPSPSTSSSVLSSPSSDEALTVFTVSPQTNELQSLSGTVVLCSDVESSEQPPNVGLENYFPKFK